MRRTRYWFGLLTGGALLMVSAGCSSVSTSQTQQVGGPRFVASDPAHVQILRNEPERSHVRLGEVRAQTSSDSIEAAKIETALRKEAAKMGADAVVVVYDKGQLTGEMVTNSWRFLSLESIKERVIVGVAIKYLEKETQSQ